MGVWYITREDVKSALDIQGTARSNAQVDRAIEAASRQVEGFLHRTFYPWTGTKYFPWPEAPRQSPSWKLYLDANELVSATTIVSGGESVTDYYLEPQRHGPPYNAIELNRGTSTAFTTGATPQRNVAVTGVFGYKDEETSVATLSAAIASTSTTTISVSNSSIGVGALIKVDSERMLVTGKNQVDTTVTLASNVAANVGTVTIPVSSGTGFSQGETILIDAEYMYIVDVAGNNLIVKRAWDGSALAAHTSSTAVYAPRQLVVTRGALGTTAATHLISATVYRFDFPGPVKTLAAAYAIDILLQEQSGYARTVGSGDNQQEATGAALKRAKEEAYTTYGRKARMRSV